jgi:hypothetical protein
MVTSSAILEVIETGVVEALQSVVFGDYTIQASPPCSMCSIVGSVEGSRIAA